MYTPKKLNFPGLVDLTELFTLVERESIKPSEVTPNARTWQVEVHKASKTKHKAHYAPMWLSGLVSHFHFEPFFKHSYILRPTQKLIDFIDKNVLLIEYDTLYIEMVIRSDGDMLILLKHNQIIGSHWLTIIPAAQWEAAFNACIDRSLTVFNGKVCDKADIDDKCKGYKSLGG